MESKKQKYKLQPCDIIAGLIIFIVIISIGFVALYRTGGMQQQYDKFSVNCWNNNGSLIWRECYCPFGCSPDLKCGDWCVYPDGKEVKFVYNRSYNPCIWKDNNSVEYVNITACPELAVGFL